MESSRARASLDEAIELIPYAKKAAYMEALKKAPHLVETESDPLCFLQRENYNVWNAAARLVAYWEERKKLFGERSLLPLTLVGKSALSQDIIQVIRAGAVFLLPNDTKGRSVVYCTDKILRDSPISVALQGLFYQQFNSMRNSQNIKDGFVFILRRSDKRGNPRRTKLIVDLMLKAMPIKIHSMHILTASGVHPIAFPLVKWFTNERAYAHVCKTPEDCAEALKAFGFTKQQLPEVLGGTWEIVQPDGLKTDEEGDWLGTNPVFSAIDPLSIASPSLDAIGNSWVQQEQGALGGSQAIRVAFGVNTSQFLASQPINTNESSNRNVQEITRCRPGNKSIEKVPVARNKTISLAKNIEDMTKCARHRKSRRAMPHGTGELDVLLGKEWARVGQGYQRFRTIINLYSDRYKATKSKVEKKQIRMEVLNCVKEEGRMMKFDEESNTWKEISSTYALEKIRESLQNSLRK